MGRLAAALLALTLPACGDAVFQCMDDAQCDGGFCEGTGYCSFEDPACDSGRRYGELAGEGLGGVCVEVDSGTSTSTSASTSTTTTTITSTITTLDDASSSSDPVTTTPITSGTVDDSSGPPPLDTEPSDSSSTGAPAETTGEPPLEVTVSFGDRSDADFQDVVEDTSLLNYSIENNLGAHRDLHLDGNDFGSWQVALIRFDVSALPDDATILAVTMVMWTFETFDPGEIGVHALTEAWVEGSGDEEPGICNWTLRDQDTPWTTEGAGEGSYDPTELATFSFDRPQADYYIDLSPDLITAWRDAPSTNFGLLLHTIDVAAPLYIPSSEAMDEELRPMLLVTYAP